MMPTAKEERTQAGGAAALDGRGIEAPRFIRVAAAAAIAWLVGCVAWYAWHTRAWPLVNDPAMMHYVVFLTGRGVAPYRQIGDYNLPGSYFPEWLSMFLAGILHVSQSAMWRVFDLSALLGSAVAMVRIARPYSRFAGIWCGGLFALYHGRDGIGQAGQRDLWMSLLLLWSIAFLFEAMRSAQFPNALRRAAGFGACAGAAAMIKPLALPWLLCLLPLLLHQKDFRSRGKLLFWAAAGFSVPLLAAMLFLTHWGAWNAFWHALHVELPYHASLARGSVLQLVGASSISSIVKMLLLAIVAWAATRGWKQGAEAEPWSARMERPLLAFCVLLGLFSFVAQGKGYSYQRYPYVAFLLLAASIVFARAVQSRRFSARAVGLAGFTFGVLFCAPAYLRGIAHARWSMPVEKQMEQSIAEQAGPGGLRSLDGRVQCLDTVTGCTDALLHLRLREATGTLYDELLFPETPDGWTLRYRGPASGAPLPAAVSEARAVLEKRLLVLPPRIIVLSAWLFPEGPGGYRELQFWPWMDHYLANRYALVGEHAFAHAENGPLGFRVYVLRRGSQQLARAGE